MIFSFQILFKYKSTYSKRNPLVLSNTAIVCLQLLQISTGFLRFLRVPTGSTNWVIYNTIDEKRGWIESGSAGGVCAAQPSNAVNSRLGEKSWKYANNEWQDGDIRVKCETHI